MNGDMITNLEKEKGFWKPRKVQEITIPGIMRAASWPHNTMKPKTGRIEREIEGRRRNVYLCALHTYVFIKIRCFFLKKILISEWNTIHKRAPEN